MNYCTKCESYYQKPGTCNCFAGTQPQPAVLPRPLVPPDTTGTPMPDLLPKIWVGTPYPIQTGVTIVANPTDSGTAIYFGDSIHLSDLAQRDVTIDQLVAHARSMMGGDTSHMLDA